MTLLPGVIIGMIVAFAIVITVGTVCLARGGASRAVVAASAAFAAGEWLALLGALVMVTS